MHCGPSLGLVVVGKPSAWGVPLTHFDDASNDATARNV